MEIKRVNKRIRDILVGATYLGEGASKEAFLKDDIVYKVPRGRTILEQSDFIKELTFPSEMAEVDNFLQEVCDWEESMVWPLGQFAIELIIWQKLLVLENEGIDISMFARIKDFYFTSDGVLVIEQELADREAPDNETWDKAWDNLKNEIDALGPTLEERFEIRLRDVREGNCGFTEDGKYKLYDFGISTTTSLDSYGSYSDCYSYSEYCEDECEDSCEESCESEPSIYSAI